MDRRTFSFMLAALLGAAPLAFAKDRDRGDHRAADGRRDHDRKGDDDDHGRGDRDDRHDGGRHRKYSVCHHQGKSGDSISVDEDAVPGHLSHGDEMGSCPASGSR